MLKQKKPPQTEKKSDKFFFKKKTNFTESTKKTENLILKPNDKHIVLKQCCLSYFTRPLKIGILTDFNPFLW